MTLDVTGYIEIYFNNHLTYISRWVAVLAYLNPLTQFVMRHIDNINHRVFINSIDSSKLDIYTAINIVEDIIAMEQVNIDANYLLRDEIALLKCEYKISHAEILLSLLRRHMDLFSGPEIWYLLF